MVSQNQLVKWKPPEEIVSKNHLTKSPHGMVHQNKLNNLLEWYLKTTFWNGIVKSPYGM